MDLQRILVEYAKVQLQLVVAQERIVVLEDQLAKYNNTKNAIPAPPVQ